MIGNKMNLIEAKCCDLGEEFEEGGRVGIVYGQIRDQILAFSSKNC